MRRKRGGSWRSKLGVQKNKRNEAVRKILQLRRGKRLQRRVICGTHGASGWGPPKERKDVAGTSIFEFTGRAERKSERPHNLGKGGNHGGFWAASKQGKRVKYY